MLCKDLGNKPHDETKQSWLTWLHWQYTHMGLCGGVTSAQSWTAAAALLSGSGSVVEPSWRSYSASIFSLTDERFTAERGSDAPSVLKVHSLSFNQTLDSWISWRCDFVFHTCRFFNYRPIIWGKSAEHHGSDDMSRMDVSYQTVLMVAIHFKE